MVIRAVEAAEYEMTIRWLIARQVDADDAAITHFLEALRHQHAHRYLGRFRRNPDRQSTPVKDHAS